MAACSSPSPGGLSSPICAMGEETILQSGFAKTVQLEFFCGGVVQTSQLDIWTQSTEHPNACIAWGYLGGAELLVWVNG